MSLKRIAVLMITCAFLYGLSGNTAAAAENITNNQVAQPQVTAPGEDDKKESVKDVTISPAPVTPAPQVTAAPKNQNKAPAKKRVKKSSKKPYTKAELRLMAAIINCETGAESYQGKLAVGIVVMNRVHSRQFPNTVKKVIYQKYQFSPVRNGSLKKRLRQYDQGRTKSSQWRSCISAAKKTLSGQKTIVYKGKVKSMKNYKFFSVSLRGARMRLGGHRFK